MSKEKKLSKDELLYVFNELVTNATTFKPESLQQERDEAYEQLKSLIESSAQEPSEAEMEEFVEKEVGWFFDVEKRMKHTGWLYGLKWKKDGRIYLKYHIQDMLKEYRELLRRG